MTNNTPDVLAATQAAADFIAGLTPAQAAAWAAIAATEAAERAAHTANTSRVQQHLVVQARIGRDTVRLADETIAPAKITRAGMRALAREHGASSITVHDTVFTRSEHNYHGDLPEKCIQDRLHRYTAKTDTLEISEHGKLIYISSADCRLRGEDLDRLVAECEFAA